MRTLYDIINILPLSLLVLILFGSYAGIPNGSPVGYAVCILSALWFITLRNMKNKNRLRSIGIVAVFLAGLIYAAGEEARARFVKDDFWIIWIICYSAGTVLAGILMDRNIWIKRIAAAALFVYCIAGTVLNQEINKGVFALVCLILLIRLAEEIQRKWQKSGCPDLKGHITRISPVFLAVSLLIFAAPAPDHPYDWQFAKDLYTAASSYFNRIYGFLTHSSDDYGKIGFSDSGKFHAGLDDNDEEVLLISSTNSTIRDFKLVGCISGDFNGREWRFDTDSKASSRMLDALETVCAVHKYDNSARANYMQRTDLNYETRFYNTRYIFSPTKIRLEASQNQNAGMTEKNGSIISDKSYLYQDNYFVSCYMVNYSNPRLGEFLSNAEPISAEEWDEAVRSESIIHTDGYSYADYQTYRSAISETYCHPCSVSEDVAKILNDIRSRSANRFETLTMLESYLSKMAYSTDCGALPDSVTDAGSFLDYFLLQSQEGYCMHFATAFVLMANEMGIPCRYVQGYQTAKDENGNIIVKQSNAHAWPEAYFENAGWIAFEPTPGFNTSAGWSINEKDPYDLYYINKAKEHEPELPETDEHAEEPEPETEPVDPLLFVIPMLGVICFLILCLIVSRLLSRRKYRRMSAPEKYRSLTQQSLRMLGYLGFRKKEDETYSEYRNRIMQSDRQNIRENLRFLSVYETVLYSDAEISEDELLSAENCCRTLRALAGKSSLKYRILLMFSK